MSKSNLIGLHPKVAGLNLSSVTSQLVDKHDHSEEDAIDITNLYRIFLHINLDRDGDRKVQLVPTDEVDQAWHIHILDTKKYEQDCLYLFGEILHHTPSYQIQPSTDLEAAKVETLHRVKKLFPDFI